MEKSLISCNLQTCRFISMTTIAVKFAAKRLEKRFCEARPQCDSRDFKAAAET